MQRITSFMRSSLPSFNVLRETHKQSPVHEENSNDEKRNVGLDIDCNGDEKKLDYNNQIFLDALSNWRYNIFTLRQDDLVTLTVHVMSDLKLFETYNIQHRTWAHFMKKVEYLMAVANTNPFHNYFHVVDVMHSLYMMIKLFDAKDYLNEIDIFVLLVSAIIHDLDHPGTNNAFQVNTGTPLSILYNGQSVLEKHHIATAFSLFQIHNDCDILKNIDNGMKTDIRKNIIHCILGTDMAFHFGMVNEIKDVAARNVSELSREDRTRPKVLPANDKIVFMKYMLHAADISNPAKPWDVSKRWSDMVIEEFFVQGDLEASLGIPVSPNCNRSVNKQDEISIGFIDFIVAPLFIEMLPFMPRATTFLGIIRDNRASWHTSVASRLAAVEVVANGVDGDAQKANPLQPWEEKRQRFEQNLARFGL